MAEALTWAFSTTINQPSQPADQPTVLVVRPLALARPSSERVGTDAPRVETVGMYTIIDDLPSPDEMDDGGEAELFIANSRPKA